MRPSAPQLRFRILLAGLVAASGGAWAIGNEPPASAHAETPAPPPEQTETPTISVEARGLLQLGDLLSTRDDFASAEIAYRRVLDAPAANRAEQQEALIGLARNCRKQGSLTKAAAVYEKFLKEFPDDLRVPEMLLELGRILRAMGAHKSALNRFYSVLNSTLKLQPTQFDHYQLLAKTAQFEIAETHFENGNFVEAGKFFGRLRLLDLAPVDRARAHFKCAYATQLLGDLDGAVRLLLDYLDKWPNDENVPEARYLLATTLRRLNRHQEALATTLDLLRSEYAQSEADPKRRAFWQRRTGNQLANEFFQSGDIPSALAIYQGLAALSEDPAWKLPTLYQVAVCSERLRAFDRARAAYQAVVEGAKATADNTELNELAKMAAWRVENMAWNEQMGRQLTSMSPSAPPAAAIAPPANHDSPPSPATPPANL